MEENLLQKRKMYFGEAIANVFKNYATFSGRARRREYWYFFLLRYIIIAATHESTGLSRLLILAIAIPMIAVGVRRLHDIGKSGWWYLICLIPLVGWIWLWVYFCIDSQKEDNKYGPSPKYY